MTSDQNPECWSLCSSISVLHHPGGRLAPNLDAGRYWGYNVYKWPGKARGTNIVITIH